jgi:uncharacterized protein
MLRSRPPAPAFDLSVILATLFGVKSALLQIDRLWTYAGPISLLASVLVASWCLRRNSESWSELGLKKPAKLGKMLMWSLILLVLTMASGIVIELIVSTAIGDRAESIDPRYANRFADLPGNLASYLYWVVVSWVVGGFLEEMLFRGMLISRFERLFSAFPFASWTAVLLQSILFGQQHYYYQGWSGALATGGLALISGVFYLLLKRTLWPLILSHGMANMTGLTLIYAGVQPAG